MKSKVKNYKAWFSSGQPLNEIGEELSRNGIIGNFEHDYENVYEWIIGESTNKDVDINISRKHLQFEQEEEPTQDLLKSEPISILLMYDEGEPSDEFLEDIGQQVAKIMNCRISFGMIEHLGADDFEYHSTKEISS